MGNIFSIQCGDALLGRCWDCIARQPLYICAIEDNLQALETARDELRELKNDVMRNVINQQTPFMVQLDQVQGWFSRVETFMPKVTVLINRGKQERKKLCIADFCSKNCRSSYILGKSLAQILKQVIDLKAVGANFQIFVMNEPAKQLQFDLETLKATREQLLALEEDVQRRIAMEEGPEQLPLRLVKLWLSMVETIIVEADELIRDGPQEVSNFCRGDISNYTFVGKVANKLGAMVTLRSQGDFDEVVGRAPSEPDFISTLQDDLRKLEIKKEELRTLKDDVAERVMLDEGRQWKPLHQVQLWLSKAERIIKEANELVKDAPQEMEKLRLRDFSNQTFMQIVGRILNDAIVLIANGNFTQVVERALPERVIERIQEPSVGTRAMLEEAWSCLVDREVGILGIYGIGGVGKTILLTEINNKFANTPNDFDAVIFVVVSKDLKLEKIKEDIWKQIGFCDKKWLKKSSDDKAKDISFVMQKKKFVLLLDDVWRQFDLRDVGVPPPNVSQNGSKVVITARSRAVCTDMDAEKMIRVEPLTSDDAWDLFCKKAGHFDEDILPLARQVASECCGLPIALIIIGRAMASRKSPDEWEHALGVLQRSSPKFQGMVDEMYQGLEVHVFKRLKFSYDCLPRRTMRSCFLYCSLFPEDFKILKNDLVHYWTSENFCTLNGGHVIVGSLIQQCLLEEQGKYVKMHDVIRDMALWIACECEEEEENFFVRSGSQFTEVSGSPKWGRVIRVSLMGNSSFDNFQEIRYFSHDVVTLFLSHNPNLQSITKDPFMRMYKLKVLDLSETAIKELPSEIAELQLLQYLNLSHTRIRELPIELNMLVKLKYLNLNHTGFLKTIPAGILSYFSELQVLKMFLCGSIEYDHVANEYFLIHELLNLENLVELSITIRSLSGFHSLCDNRRLLNCTRAIVLQGLEFKSREHVNISSLTLAKHLNLLLMFGNKYGEELVVSSRPTDNQLIFSSLQEVIVSNDHGMGGLTWVILARKLTILKVTFNRYIEAIVSREKLSELQASVGSLHFFSKLQVLELYGLPKLESIYWQALPFPCLRQIDIYDCPLLKKLPLNSSSATGCKVVIKGEKSWRENLEWEDDATRDAFSSCFQKI